jgi:hypothetical protein
MEERARKARQQTKPFYTAIGRREISKNAGSG